MAPLNPGARAHALTMFRPRLMATYYSQRASAGLIITEANPHQPRRQRLALRRRTVGRRARGSLAESNRCPLHGAGGRIFAPTLAHGPPRSSLLARRSTRVRKRVPRAPGKAHNLRRQYGLTSRHAPLAIEEIPRLIGDYVTAAQKLPSKQVSMEFSCTAANGYLIDHS